MPKCARARSTCIHVRGGGDDGGDGAQCCTQTHTFKRVSCDIRIYISVAAKCDASRDEKATESK